MRLHCPGWRLAIVLAAVLAAGPAPARTLRVCADPDNMPFSNDRGEGFEDRIAALLAADLHSTLQITMRSSRRGFIRRTLQSGDCDVVMGVPSGFPPVASTRPYYRSSYVFVSLRRRGLTFGSYNDPTLRTLKIGLHALGMEGANTPPALALAQRGITGNIVGFPMFGGDGETAVSPGRIVDAVAQGEIDVAIVWGPIAGYYARAHKDALQLAEAPADPAQPMTPFAYDISLGVRKDQTALRDELDESLDRHRAEIRSILDDFGVPLAGATAGTLP